MTIEGLYEKIGGMGRFQIITIVLISSCMLTIGWSMLQMTFAGAIPDFSCQYTDPHTNSTMVLDATINQCSLNGTTCEQFVYKTSSRTVITEWGLLCELKWTKKVIISLQMVGVLFGAFISGQMGDLFGRKKVLYSFGVAHAFLNIVAAFSSSWIMFTCFRFFIGVCIGAVVLVVLPYQVEFLPSKWRPLIGIVPSWSIGVAFFASAALLLSNWSYNHIACGVLSLPSLFGCLFVPESPRWLAVQGKLNEAEEVVRKIARVNKTTAPSNVVSVLEKVREEQLMLIDKSKKYTYLDLFNRGWRKALIPMVFFYIWFSMAVVYYGISFGVASLTGNLYLNIFLLGIMEIPVQTTTFCFNNKIGRHKTTFMFLLLTFLPVVGCLLFFYLTTSQVRGVGINVCSQMAKMMVGSAWSSIQVWGTESFPTATRNLGCGFQAMGARVGGIMAPLIINLDDYKGVSYVILSALLLVALLSTFSIPETKGKCLQDGYNNNNNLQRSHEDITTKDTDNMSMQLPVNS